jgi:DNA-binding response OmpR family regulator
MRDAWIYSRSREHAGEISAALAELGFGPRHVSTDQEIVPSGRDGATVRRPALAVVVVARGEPLTSELLGRLRSTDELCDVPLLLAVEPEHVRSLQRAGIAHELLVKPFSVEELEARVARATRDATEIEQGNVARAGSLALDLATYQVSIDGRPISFAYMEYELLKFLMTHPNRVFSREALLARVWGYEYYGGARTVDVHIRRVRAKLGQEHAARIKTIRSVGYLFELRARAGS